MTDFRKNDWVEKFAESGASLGCAYILGIGNAGEIIVSHEAKPTPFPVERLALVRRGRDFNALEKSLPAGCLYF
jgi:hypothetical protein